MAERSFSESYRTTTSTETYVDGNHLFPFGEPAFPDHECFSLNGTNRKPQVGENGDGTGEKALRIGSNVSSSGNDGIPWLFGHTSMTKSQNHPGFPAVPRMGKIAAARRLEKTRAKFKLDLTQEMTYQRRNHR